MFFVIATALVWYAALEFWLEGWWFSSAFAMVSGFVLLWCAV